MMTATPTRVSFRPHPSSVKCARNWLSLTYRDGLAEHTLANVALMVSELITNALRYSRSAAEGTRVEVVVELDEQTITVEVIDAGSDQHYPTLRQTDFVAETGRGLHIIDALADEWGVRALDDGRRAVWATVKL